MKEMVADGNRNGADIIALNKYKIKTFAEVRTSKHLTYIKKESKHSTYT